MPALLQVEDLTIRFRTDQGRLTAVDGLSFSVLAGETLSIVGESGCGKSVTALALMRLLPSGTEVGGTIRFDGQNTLTLPERQMRELRGNRLSFVSQDPMAALNPVMTVGQQIVEAIRAHERIGRGEAWRRAQELLDLVQIPDARRRLDEYPHRFSGGMRQRVAIAIAIASRPSLLIADEPTTALDVTIQAQILKLLHGLQRELGMALILITHDLGVVAETADRVLVMYAGRQVEHQDVHDLFLQPLHPYTSRLIAAKPRATAGAGGRHRLREISGVVPSLTTKPQGCSFAPRCDFADAVCHSVVPKLQVAHRAALVSCHKAGRPLARIA
jgi:peptide/nickel transport system ATP-binding protein